MLRTRDFFLLALCIVFLLVAIGGTVLIRVNQQGLDPDKLKLANVGDPEYVAVLHDDVADSRAERLDDMRKKIAADKNLYIASAVEPEPLAVEQPEEEENSEEPKPDIGEQRCPYYVAYQGVWSAQGVQFSVAEGVRLVYREVAAVTVPITASSSPTAPQKQVLAQLPVRTVSLGGSNCVPSDVIGISTGGALIRNTDAQVYAPMAESALLGYALDGYPIYGTSAAATDSCGGRTVAGVYRYQLSPDRSIVVNCFTGQPSRI